MTGKMAVFGLQHQRSRFAGRIAVLKHFNRVHQAKINERQVILDGRQAKLDAQQAEIDRCADILAVNEAEISELSSHIATVDAAATAAFGVVFDAPIPRMTVPKRHYAGWGALTRTLLREMACADGAPLTTQELAIMVNDALSLALSDEELQRLKVALRHTLKRLHNKGTVKRGDQSRGRYSTWVL